MENRRSSRRKSDKVVGGEMGRVEGVGGRAHGGSNDVGGWRTGGEDGNRGAAGGRGVWRLDRSYNIA